MASDFFIFREVRGAFESARFFSVKTPGFLSNAPRKSFSVTHFALLETVAALA